MNETLELGGNISLAGFKDVDKAQLIVVKKIVGQYAKRFSEICERFEKLSITMKPVHKTEKSEIFELHAKAMDNGKQYVAQISDRNLFFALDKVLKKVENEIQK